ncbi:O-methyltransferase [Cerasicoccus frondis]|uniref:O-methyltransferase n=1 Tax=Cerasicoccus frondis TaxID=490090 RepID=UPI002852D44B|nr:class I SAM-dependent methyltransferase [Cerasicoccus frondis]
MKTQHTACTLTTSPASEVLEALFADAAAQHAEFHATATPRPNPWQEGLTPFERFSRAKDRYMPIDQPFGNLLYSLIRATGAKTVVEFGTSFGISTIYLASAVRDNGAGQVITTEFIPEKAATAKDNLTRAGLADLIDFRVGDAMETLLEPLPGQVDLLFLDGDKSMYLGVVKLLEPFMKTGCLIVSDNTDHDGAASYLEHVRHADNGYISTPLLTPGDHKGHSGHEVSVRL